MSTKTPFCCDITSGKPEEQKEFKKLFDEASNFSWWYLERYYGYLLQDKFSCYTTLEIATKRHPNIIPLSEGIAILKEMVGETNFYCKEYDNVGHICESQCDVCKRAENMPMVGEETKPNGDYVMLPRKLTAENGAKGLLIGEFKESVHFTVDGEENKIDVDVSWTTIKAIYDMVVANLQPKP
jgi:hypothetical protein